MTTTFNRQELYELVWSQSTRTVAETVGVSDAALAKACRKAGIPTPPLGYWARKAAGQGPIKIALPPRFPGASDEIGIGPSSNSWHPGWRQEMLDRPVPPVPVFEESIEVVADRVRKMVSKVPSQKSFDKAFGDISRLLARDEGRRKSGWSFDKPFASDGTSLRSIRSLSMQMRYAQKKRAADPQRGRVRGGTILREFMAMRGILLLWFKSKDACASYCEAGWFQNGNFKYELTKSWYLSDDRLPDLGEFVNELWGVPIPIRGGDVVFRGGLKFSTRQGLVLAIHGGPGSGKTSLALALGAYLAPLEIETLFLTAEMDTLSRAERSARMSLSRARSRCFTPSRRLDFRGRARCHRHSDTVGQAVDRLTNIYRFALENGYKPEETWRQTTKRSEPVLNSSISISPYELSPFLFGCRFHRFLEILHCLIEQLDLDLDRIALGCAL